MLRKVLYVPVPYPPYQHAGPPWPGLPLFQESLREAVSGVDQGQASSAEDQASTQPLDKLGTYWADIRLRTTTRAVYDGIDQEI